MIHQTWRFAYVGTKKANNKWTSNLTNHLMRNFLCSYWSFETTIALDVVNLDAYELHPWYEKIFNNFMMTSSVLYFTYDRGWLKFKSTLCILISITIYECKISCIHLVTYIFIIEVMHVLLDFTTNKKNVYILEFSKHVANACDSWFWRKGACPRGLCHPLFLFNSPWTACLGWILGDKAWSDFGTGIINYSWMLLRKKELWCARLL